MKRYRVGSEVDRGRVLRNIPLILRLNWYKFFAFRALTNEHALAIRPDLGKATMDFSSVASRIPTRRRAMQACVACRMRKTRCDVAQPRCGYCAMQNIECVYRDSRQPRIDYNTQVLLERMQLLEERLLASGAGGVAPSISPGQLNRQLSEAQEEVGMDLEMTDVQIPFSHTANANHVYTWPIIRQLLSKVSGTAELLSVDTTDVFFGPLTRPAETPANSWRLYPLASSDNAVSRNRDLIDVYFVEVTVFFPLLSSNNLHQIHDAVITQDANPNSPEIDSVPAADYSLLLLVLSLASFMASGDNKIGIDMVGRREKMPEYEQLWSKAKLLLGCISDEMSLTSAQCTMLARYV